MVGFYHPRELLISVFLFKFVTPPCNLLNCGSQILLINVGSISCILKLDFEILNQQFLSSSIFHIRASFLKPQSFAHTITLIKFTHFYCRAQFQLASSVQVQLRTKISLIISVRPHTTPPTPPHPTRASIFEALLGHLQS